MSKRKRYVEAAVFRILNELNGVGSGGRNVALNHAAFGLGQFVGAGALDYNDAAMALDSAAASLGISKAEAANTIKSGLRSGCLPSRQPQDPSIKCSLPRSCCRACSKWLGMRGELGSRIIMLPLTCVGLWTSGD
jgi:hypothetical protein